MMAKKINTSWLVEEVAEFLARSPSREELLAFRPSIKAQDRHEALVAKSKTRALSSTEEWELVQFEHLEILLQSIKARIRRRRPVAS
jgi:hypothetical protein